MATKKTLENVDAGTFVAVNSPAEGSITEKPNKVEKSDEQKILGDNPEVFSHNGKKIYARNPKTKEIVFYNKNGDIEDIEAVDRLESEYQLAPEFGPNGEDKKGELKVRFTKEFYENLPPEQGKGKGWVTKEVPEEEADFVSERQDYVDSEGNVVDAWTRTIPMKHYDIVKLMRGQIGQEENK